MKESIELLRRRVVWALRLWPVLGILPVLALHLWILRVDGISPQLVNKWVSALTQIAGGILVIRSIDQNLGEFGRKRLMASARQWLREYPRTMRTATISSSVTFSVSGTGSVGSATILRGPDTVDEKIADLYAKLAEMSATTSQRFEQVDQRVEAVRADAMRSIEEAKANVTRVAERLDRTTVGGIKGQVFGILLAIYGAIAGVFG